MLMGTQRNSSVLTVLKGELRFGQLTGNTNLLDLPLTLHTSQHLDCLENLLVSFTSDFALLLGLETACNGVFLVIFRAGG